MSERTVEGWLIGDEIAQSPDGPSLHVEDELFEGVCVYSGLSPVIDVPWAVIAALWPSGICRECGAEKNACEHREWGVLPEGQ